MSGRSHVLRKHSTTLVKAHNIFTRTGEIKKHALSYRLISGGYSFDSRLPREPLGLPQCVDSHEKHDGVEAQEDEDGHVEVDPSAVDREEAAGHAYVGLGRPTVQD